MAKNEAFEAYVAEVLASVPEDRREAVKSTLLDDSIAGKLADGFLRQSDYSRNMDDVKKKRQEMEAYLAGEAAKVDGWKSYSEQALKDAAEAKEQLDKYRATYGDLTVDGRAGTTLRKEDIEALINAQVDKRAAGLSEWTVDAVDKISSLKWNHQKQFGTDFKTSELTAFAAKHNISDLDIAYKAFVEPQLEAKREESFNAKMAEAVKQAREEGKREAIKERFPAPGSSRSMYSETSKDDLLPNTSDRVRAAAADLEQAMAGVR